MSVGSAQPSKGQPGATVRASTAGRATNAPSSGAAAGSSGAVAGSASAAAATSAQPAAPEEPSEEARSRAIEQFQKGSAAFSAHHYKDAIDLFLEADRLVKNPAFAFNAALAYEQMGDSSGALGWYREYLRRAPEAADKDKQEAAVERLERVLASKGVQQVTVLSIPEGATVIIDGRPVGVTPWTGDIAPGSHQALLRLNGCADVKTLFELGKYQAMDISRALEKAEQSAPQPTAIATGSARPAALPPVRTSPTVAPWTWVSLGVGVAGLGAALGCELGRASAETDAKNATTQIDAGDAADRMQNLQLAARVLVGIGAVATVAGGVLLAVDLGSGGGEEEAATPESGPKAKAGLGCGLGGCGLMAQGTF